eukprot:14662799-Ditylum_brightwellii.AAC.1
MSKPDDWCLLRHNHKWSTCPNNPRSDSYSGVHYKEVHYKADAKKKNEKELHMHEKEDKKEISMTELAFTDGKEDYFSSEYSPMVQRVHPETIIDMPITPRSKKMKMVNVLLDICATLLLMNPVLLDSPPQTISNKQILQSLPFKQ